MVVFISILKETNARFQNNFCFKIPVLAYLVPITISKYFRFEGLLSNPDQIVEYAIPLIGQLEEAIIFN